MFFNLFRATSLKNGKLRIQTCSTILKEGVVNTHTQTNTHTHIYIYIYIKSHWDHGFPYHPTLPAGLQNYILFSHRDDVNMFWLVGQHWHIHVQGFSKKHHCPVGWGSRIHRLHLCRGVRLSPPNECPGYDTKRSDGEAPVMLEFWGNAENHFIAIAPWSTLARNGSTYWLNKTNGILMLNWIVWIRTVWLNWIAWNRNVFYI